jgi:stage II sporulation SpoAA-like protein
MPRFLLSNSAWPCHGPLIQEAVAMFTLIPFANDKVLGFRIEGKITGEMLEQMLAVVEAKLQEHPRARIYVEMPAFEGMSVEALYKDLKYGISHWNRFEREAVVTDQRRLEVMVGLADRLIPGVEVKVFPTSEADSARDWIQAL